MPSVGHDSSTRRSFGPGEYAPTEDAYTSRGTPACATARKTLRLPSTLVARVTDSSRDGWISQARCTTASAPSKWRVRSSRDTSAVTHVVFGNSVAGRRRAIPMIDSTAGSPARLCNRLVPTLPEAPVIATRMPVGYPGAAATNAAGQGCVRPPAGARRGPTRAARRSGRSPPSRRGGAWSRSRAARHRSASAARSSIPSRSGRTPAGRCTRRAPRPGCCRGRRRRP